MPPRARPTPRAPRRVRASVISSIDPQVAPKPPRVPTKGEKPAPPNRPRVQRFAIVSADFVD